jgi:hypothetical protein
MRRIYVYLDKTLLKLLPLDSTHGGVSAQCLNMTALRNKIRHLKNVCGLGFV